MPHSTSRPALTLLSLLTLLGLAACTPTATASVSPTATTPPAPTATATLAPAPTPTNVPAGWTVLVKPHFSLAYPPGWTPTTYPQQDGSTLYIIASPSAPGSSVRVLVYENASDSDLTVPYCLPVSSDVQHTTLAALPMAYMLSGEGLLMRTWFFANAQRTAYSLSADDAQSSTTIQAQDTAILDTFRPDNADPWHC